MSWLRARMCLMCFAHSGFVDGHSSRGTWRARPHASRQPRCILARISTRSKAVRTLRGSARVAVAALEICRVKKICAEAQRCEYIANDAAQGRRG